MKYLFLVLSAAISIFAVGCQVESEMAKKGVENYQPSPTPARIAVPVETIDPADIVQADITANGPTLFVNESDSKKTLNCTKYNRVMINGAGNEVKITGVCSQIMVNGNRNQIDANAAAEITTYGSENVVKYSKYANGKKPQTKDSSGSNIVSKAEPSDAAPKK